MIVGVGIDLVDLRRFRRAVDRWGERLLTRLFTFEEIRVCEAKRDMSASLAVRFAAKEAVFKALGTGWSGRSGWHGIEILSDEGGRPVVRIGEQLRLSTGPIRIHLSLSHEREMTTAVVVIEKEHGDGS